MADRVLAWTPDNVDAIDELAAPARVNHGCISGSSHEYAKRIDA